MHVSSCTGRGRTRAKRIVVGGLAALALTGLAAAGTAAADPGSSPLGTVRALDQSGDHPLTTVETFVGTVGVVVDGNPHHVDPAPDGSFSISGIPAGASVLRAWLVVSDYGTPTVAGTFAGTPIPAPSGISTDAPYPLNQRRYDVTATVNGNGSYAYDLTGFGYCMGVALVVVYEEATLPWRRIVVNDGAEDLQNATSTTTFAGVTAAGAGRLVVFVCSDDASGGMSEALAFNGGVVLGPGDVFAQNLGPVTSLIEVDVSVAQGSNTASVTTGADQFGWLLAILVAPEQVSSPVPVDGAAGLAILSVLLALAGAAVLRRR